VIYTAAPGSEDETKLDLARVAGAVPPAPPAAPPAAGSGQDQR
jgi:hypothetical protein